MVQNKSGFLGFYSRPVLEVMNTIWKIFMCFKTIPNGFIYNVSKVKKDWMVRSTVFQKETSWPEKFVSLLLLFLLLAQFLFFLYVMDVVMFLAAQ